MQFKKQLTISLLVTLISSGLLALPTLAADEQPDGKSYNLRYQFKMGEVLRYEVDHRASVRNTMEGSTQTVKTRSQSVKAWKIIDVMPNGEIEFANVVESVRMTNQLPDRSPLVYDSKKDKTPPAGFEDVAKVLGKPLSTIRMTPQGKIVNRQVKHAKAADGDDSPITLILPKDPVAIGDAWNEPIDVTVAPKGGGKKTVQARKHFKLTKVEHGVAIISYEYQVLSPINSHIEAQLVRHLSKGTIRFDIEKGRVLSQKYDIDRRILGFEGPSSSMHYLMSLTEKPVETKEPKTANRSTKSGSSDSTR